MSPTHKDGTAREEVRVGNLVNWSQDYLKRIETAYTRAIGSTETPKDEERAMFETAKMDSGMVRQLFVQLRNESKSDQDALQKLLKWGQSFG